MDVEAFRRRTETMGAIKCYLLGVLIGTILVSVALLTEYNRCFPLTNNGHVSSLGPELNVEDKVPGSRFMAFLRLLAFLAKELIGIRSPLPSNIQQHMDQALIRRRREANPGGRGESHQIAHRRNHNGIDQLTGIEKGLKVGEKYGFSATIRQKGHESHNHFAPVDITSWLYLKYFLDRNSNPTPTPKPEPVESEIDGNALYLEKLLEESQKDLPIEKRAAPFLRPHNHTIINGRIPGHGMHSSNNHKKIERKGIELIQYQQRMRAIFDKRNKKKQRKHRNTYPNAEDLSKAKFPSTNNNQTIANYGNNNNMDDKTGSGTTGKRTKRNRRSAKVTEAEIQRNPAFWWFRSYKREPDLKFMV